MSALSQLGRSRSPTMSNILLSVNLSTYCFHMHTSVTTQWPGNCAIAFAAREGRSEVVSLLLEAGANIDLQNKVK